MTGTYIWQKLQKRNSILSEGIKMEL
jgi:hypothetical protein